MKKKKEQETIDGLVKVTHNGEISKSNRSREQSVSSFNSKSTKIKCSHCDYEWTTMSSSIMVTCPSCLFKTKKENKK